MAIYTNFEAMERAENELKTVKARYIDEMRALESLVKEVNMHDWQGPDADKFIETTNEKLNKVREEYDRFLNSITQEIEKNREKFRAVQQRNMNILN